MSRIYNLKPVSSRSGVSHNERQSDVQTIKLFPRGQFASTLPKIPVCSPSDDVKNTEISALHSVQQQVEQLYLKEQEVIKQNDGDKQKPMIYESFKDHKTPNISTTSLSQKTDSRSSTQPLLYATKTVNTEKDSDVISRCSSPATPQFTIRSATGRSGRKGTTITITPRKFNTSVIPPASTTTSTTVKSTSDQSKKRFPTAEEIKVIGGYQNLGRSCLVKNRHSPKMVRVCFNDSQLESVCMYPSEDSVAEEELISDDWRKNKQGQENKDEEEEEEDGVLGAGRGISRVLRVDESCRR